MSKALVLRVGLLLAALGAIAGAIVYLMPDSPPAQAPPPDASPQGTSQPGEPQVAPAVGYRAPDFYGLQVWINSPPLTLERLRGKVVIIDFWTYTCINCIRTFPYLKDWYRKYADEGLVIVGVHTPEFTFEQEYDNVLAAVMKYELPYPVALDNEWYTWRAYENQFWPHKFLIDKDGVIRYHRIGEGGYAETEEMIRTLLREIGASPATAGVGAQDPDFSLYGELTPETYAGYGRGVLGNEGGQVKDEVAEYADAPAHREGRIYLQGQWFAGFESINHARSTTGLEDYVLLRYNARSVNLVTNRAAEPFRVYITLDGQDLTEANKGSDVQFDEEGHSYILVDSAWLYNLVDGPGLSLHEIKLSSNSPYFSIYAFTFGP